MPVFAVRNYVTEHGRDPIAEFLANLPPLSKAMCEQVIEWLATGEIDQHPKNRSYISDGLWELRVSFMGVQYRILYILGSGEAHLLAPFIKKTPQTPKNQIDLARRRARELAQRGVIT